MQGRAIVLDANILIRAVLGQRVRAILETYASDLSFFIPETAYLEAEEHLSTLIARRGGDPAKGLLSLSSISALGTILSSETYCHFEAEARKRFEPRDPDDWPILAAALALQCPIWTEDTDFFGCGVATWTSGSIAVFLAK
jgi:predicted nucleic acid-binding protein